MTTDRRPPTAAGWKPVARRLATALREPGRKLRILAGVDEQLLGWVPSERARYTALGGVILGTAVIAGLSMWNALSAVMGGGHVALVLPVLVWMLFILNLDRWLVSSSAGVQWGRRLAVLLPRLVIAFFFGFIIAEPLVLQIFHTAVVQHIKDQREEQLDTLRTELLRCNPVPAKAGAAPVPAPANCAGKLLTFDGTPAGVAQELAALRADARALQQSVTRETTELDRLNELARQECAGRSGSGFTGRVGEGPNCRRLRGEADEYAAAHPIAQHNARLDDLRRQISGLEGQFRLGTEGFHQTRAVKIDERVGEMAAHQGPIGMLERLRALDELTGANPFLFVACWLVRVFFILIDCLPVLVKFFAGATAYDRLVEEKVTSAGRLFARTVRTDEVKQLAELELDQYATELDITKRRETYDLESRRHAATVQTDLDQEVDDLARSLRTTTVPASRPEPAFANHAGAADAGPDSDAALRTDPRGNATARHHPTAPRPTNGFLL